jgi:hypothetical protein
VDNRGVDTPIDPKKPTAPAVKPPESAATLRKPAKAAPKPKAKPAPKPAERAATWRFQPKPAAPAAPASKPAAPAASIESITGRLSRFLGLGDN